MAVNENKMDGLMMAMGHTEKLLGTEYLRVAIRHYEPGMPLTKVLYPKVAAVCGTSASRAERAMRHSIERAWDRADEEIRLAYFGYTINPDTGRPTVGEYVSRMARLCREN